MRSEILKVLESAMGTFVSGEALMKATGISRQGVWKHIQALIEEGYRIQSVKGQGYCLASRPSGLTQSLMERLAHASGLVEKGFHFEVINSTNAYLKDLAKKVGTAIAVADEQTAGRGRLGRLWSSEKGEGLWMSLLLRPQIMPSKASMLTQVVAASMVKALEVFYDVPIKIKWPNDLWVGERKICGILTEMAAELHAIEYVIIGVGLNLTQQSFSADLEGVAASLSQFTEKPIDRAEIIEKFLTFFKADYEQFLKDGDLSSFTDFLNEKAYLNGQLLWISTMPDAEGDFRGLGVNSLGELIVEDGLGNQIGLSYGEVSVRRKQHATGL